MAALHVSINAEPLFELGSFQVTNSVLTGSFVSLLLILFALYFASSKKKLSPGTGLQNLVESIVEALYNFTRDVAGDTKARIFFPLIATSFIFILFNNWVSVIPGVGTIGINHQAKDSSHASLIPSAHAAETADQAQDQADEHQAASSESIFTPIIRPATADLNTTLALALISVILTQFYGIKYLGISYFKKFFNFTNPINTFVGLLEIVSEFAKIISFAFRLFGNIFAGEVLLAVTAFLVPLFAPIPFLGLEVFVGFIQALVFAMLTLVFINMATISHDHA